MKQFNKMAAQGDIMFMSLDKYTDDEIKELGFTQCDAIQDTDNQYFVLAHSETGHNHVLLEKSAQMLIDKTNDFIGELKMLDDGEVKHLRDFDTHESILLKKGSRIGIKKQREYTFEGFRKAQD